MTAQENLRAILKAFDEHTTECKQCGFLATVQFDYIALNPKDGVNLNLWFLDKEKPKLCPKGKNLLLDVFNVL